MLAKTGVARPELDVPALNKLGDRDGYIHQNAVESGLTSNVINGTRYILCQEVVNGGPDPDALDRGDVVEFRRNV